MSGRVPPQLSCSDLRKYSKCLLCARRGGCGGGRIPEFPVQKLWQPALWVCGSASSPRRGASFDLPLPLLENSGRGRAGPSELPSPRRLGPDCISPHPTLAGQAAYSEIFESYLHCARCPCSLRLGVRAVIRPGRQLQLHGGQGCPERKAQLPSNGLYPGSGRQSPRSLGRLSD